VGDGENWEGGGDKPNASAGMSRVKCDQCGQSYASGEAHACQAVNDNVDKGPPTPFDEKRWRRAYMREYMRRRRRKPEPGEPQDQPKDQAS
jgi:hypothetical protein